MQRKIIQIDEKNATAAARARRPATRARSGWWTERRALCARTTATGWATALPACPTGAISFEEREAPAYDAAAVAASKAAPRLRRPSRGRVQDSPRLRRAAPALRLPRHAFEVHRAEAPGRDGSHCCRTDQPAEPVAGADQAGAGQRALFQEREPADRRRLRRLRLRGLPPPVHEEPRDADRLPEAGQRRLRRQAHRNPGAQRLRRVTVVRMEVPCCGGIAHAVTEALKRSGKFIPWQVVTLSTDGGIIDE